MPKNKQSHKEPEYKIIDMGTSESEEDFAKKFLSQIPAGKAIVIHDEDQTLQGKIVVQIMDIKDIPPNPKDILIKAGFKDITETDETKPNKKRT